MSTILNNAKALTSKISDSVASIRKAASETQGRIAELIAERESIFKSPVTREDYIAMLMAEIDMKADFYRDRAARNFKLTIAGNTGSDMLPRRAEVGVLIRQGQEKQDGMKRLTGNLRGATWGGDFDSDSLTQLAATFLLRDEMKLAAAEAIGGIEPWPFPAAKPFNESVARVGEIDAELSSLNEQLGELQDAAGSLGLDLQERIEPSPEAVDTANEFLARQAWAYKELQNKDAPEFWIVVDGKKKLRRIDPETGEATDRDPPAWNGGVFG